jgi:hypothetical protein
MNWFFIAGNFRSGTTLMRLCLNAHPDVTCLDEMESVRRLGVAGPPKAIDVSDVSTPTVGFKSPRHSPYLTKLWPQWCQQLGSEGKCIFMLRDVRQVVVSMAQMWPAWNERADLIEMMRVRFRHPDFAEYRDQLAAVEASAEPPISGMALFWKWNTESFYKLRAAGLPVFGVNYDDLVTSPGVTLRRVLDFLGMEWNEAVPSPPNGASGVAEGNNAVRKIDTASLTKWKDVFTDQQVALMLSTAGEVNDRIAAENDTITAGDA